MALARLDTQGPQRERLILGLTRVTTTELTLVIIMLELPQEQLEA